MALSITIEISDDDQKALEHNLLDIPLWVSNAVAGKINSCQKRMDTEAIRVLSADDTVSNIGGTRPARIAALHARPDYMNRTARDAAEATGRSR